LRLTLQQAAENALACWYKSLNDCILKEKLISSPITVVLLGFGFAPVKDIVQQDEQSLIKSIALGQVNN
jgi:hypothetical protein